MILPIQLQEFGLTPKEAKIYLASLQLGPSGVQMIAKQSSLHRVSVYDVLPSLVGKGLLRQTINGKKRLFEAADPDTIFQSIHSQEIKYINLLPELRAIQHKAKYKPKVLYYEGRENVWKGYLDRIEHELDKKENLVYGTSTELLSLFPKEYQEFTKKRLQKKIKAKIIVEKSKYGLLEAEHAKNELREVKFLPPGKSFKAHTIIYGNRVMTVSWESMILVIVEDQANADNQRIVWEMLWDSLIK